MLGRTIRDLTVSVHRNQEGLVVRVTTRYCESDIGGGRIRSKIDSYEQLTDGEAIDVLEAVASGRLPGYEMADQGALFEVV